MTTQDWIQAYHKARKHKTAMAQAFAYAIVKAGLVG